jgi:hypothetical protein
MSAGPIQDFAEAVAQQLPERLRGRLQVLIYSDAYHLRTRVRFVDRQKPSWHYECWLDTGEVGAGRHIAYLIPELELARLAASF